MKLKIDAETSQFGLQQLIKEPTHILRNSSSFINLTFTSHPSLVMESGVHPSLHSSCQHQSYFSIIKRFPASCNCFIKIVMLLSMRIRLNYSITFLLTNVLQKAILAYFLLSYSNEQKM